MNSIVLVLEHRQIYEPSISSIISKTMNVDQRELLQFHILFFV